MSLIEILVILLVVAWALGGFVVPAAAWSVSSPINLLLLIVLVLILVRLIQGKRIE